MGLHGEQGSTESLTRAEVIQLIGNAMAGDPAKRLGTGGLRHFIRVHDGVTLPLSVFPLICMIIYGLITDPQQDDLDDNEDT